MYCEDDPTACNARLDYGSEKWLNCERMYRREMPTLPRGTGAEIKVKFNDGVNFRIMLDVSWCRQEVGQMVDKMIDKMVRFVSPAMRNYNDIGGN
jgi:hypothetical protein